MNRFIKISVLVISFLHAFVANAQSKVEMADVFRSEGKIYVVIAVALVVLFGLVAYLVFTDRKLKKLEQEVNDKG